MDPNIQSDSAHIFTRICFHKTSITLLELFY